MQQVFSLIENAAQSDAPVIILGESGTGKELAARAIHQLGDRKKSAYVKVNCAALTESLLESELFGHVKGAYTGAYKGRAGRFEMAQGGDIFLDEIGDLPLSTQVKLLRVLEEKVIERVGDSKSIPVDVRVISATNKNLSSLVKTGAFRKDLYFRINVIPIQMPPLRERVEDIPLLAESFFRKLRIKSGKSIEGISNLALEVLIRYPWPGNVRELKSAFEYAFVTCQEPLIHPHHLPPDILKEEKSNQRCGCRSPHQTGNRETTAHRCPGPGQGQPIGSRGNPGDLPGNRVESHEALWHHVHQANRITQIGLPELPSYGQRAWGPAHKALRLDSFSREEPHRIFLRRLLQRPLRHGLRLPAAAP